MRLLHFSRLLAIPIASAGCNAILGIEDHPVAPRDSGASTAFESEAAGPVEEDGPAPDDTPGAEANGDDVAPEEGGNAQADGLGGDGPAGPTGPAPDAVAPATDAAPSVSDDDRRTTQPDGPASGADGGVDAADSSVAADSSHADAPAGDSSPKTYASCLAVLKAAPTSSTGTYSIALGGTSLAVHCDMEFAGGGWTLVQSTNGGTCAPATETAGTVALGSCAYMPLSAVTALAQASSTVHVRSANGSAAPTAYVTSATSLPIQNLRMGLVTNASEAVGDAVTEEAAWTVVGDPGATSTQGRTPQSILAFTCSVAGEMWPAVYHACGNGADGFVLDVVDNVSLWNWGIMPHVNVPMEVYVR